MADTNQQADELARVMERLNTELAQLGYVTKETQEKMTDAQMKAKYGIENFTKGTQSAAGAITELAGAGIAAGKAMYEGKKGAAAFNDSIDGMAKAAQAAGIALSLMIPGGPIIKLFVAGVTAAVTATAAYVKASNEMADKLYKGYSKMAQSGAAASDGMTGMYKDAKKLGLSMNELDSFVGLVSENSKDLALFAGSAFEGRKKFAEMGEAMEPYRKGLIAAGYTQEQINEGTMGYLKLQTRMGAAQKMTTDELAAGAKKYLNEQDALAKITGQTRKEMEANSERAMQQQQFAAKIRELEMAGKKDEANELMKLNNMYSAMGPKTAAAFQASVTGNLANADALEANMASQGEMLRTADAVAKGQMKASEAAQSTGKAIGKFNDEVNIGASSVNAGLYDFAEGEKARQMTEGDITENLKKADEERKKQGMDGAKAADGMTDQYAKNIKQQQDLNKKMEDVVFKGIDNALVITNKLGNATDTVATGFEILGKAINKFLNILGLGTKESTVPAPPTKEQEAASVAVTKSRSDSDAADKKLLDQMDATEALKKNLATIAKTNDKSAETTAKITELKKQIVESEQKELILNKEAKLASAKKLEAAAEQANANRAARGQASTSTATPTAPAGGGGGASSKSAPSPAAVPTSVDQLKDAGLTVKQGDVQKEGAVINPKTIELAKNIQASMKGFGYFSGFNDKFHNEKSPTSEHTKGNALDFVMQKAPSKEEGAEIVGMLKSMGASFVIDEYNNPSSKATAGHIHAAVPGYADGGIAETPQLAFVAEKGPEAMIPLVDGAIPIKLDLKQSQPADPTPQIAKMLADFSGGSMMKMADEQKMLEPGLADNNMKKMIDNMLGAKPEEVPQASFPTEMIQVQNDLMQFLQETKSQESTNVSTEAASFASASGTSMTDMIAAMNETKLQTMEMVGLLSDLIRAQKDQNDISGRILQASMN